MPKSEYCELASQTSNSDEDVTVAEIGELRASRLSARRWRFISLLFLATTLSLGLLLLLISAKTKTVLPALPISGESLACGDSTATALARGCTYHSLSHAWLSEHCNVINATDAVISALNYEPCRFWLDAAGEKEIKEDDWNFLETGTELYTTQSHHVSHCVYLLAQSAAALMHGGAMVEENARKWDHIQLCIETILHATRRLPDWNKIKGNVHLGSGDCW